MIRVELIDGDYVRVSPKGLDLLLRTGRVKRFLRKSGWVVVGADPLRDTVQSVLYDGPERRQVPDLHVANTTSAQPSAPPETLYSYQFDQGCHPRRSVFRRD